MATLLGITDHKDIIIIQALLLLASRGIFIDEVHYIRTSGADIPTEYANFYKNRNISLSIESLDSNGVLKKEDDYMDLEDIMFKWYNSKSKSSQAVYVFIGGGHKLHSLALQKCAFLFGADDVFHMFVNMPRDSEPKSIDEINSAIELKTILYASLGKEPGWSALRKISGDNTYDGHFIRNMIAKIGERTINQINEYPFESISLLPSTAVQWLLMPLTTEDYSFVLSLPKVELHCHLGGFATAGDLLDAVRDAADETVEIGHKKNIEFPSEWPLPIQPYSLDLYMALGDNNGSYILKNIGCLHKQIDLLYDHFLVQNVGYAEVRCSPYNYVSEECSGLEILQIIQRRFDDLMSKSKEQLSFWTHVNLIVIATRTVDGDHRKIQDHLELAKIAESSSKKEGRCKIVGVDLAGFEQPSTRASYYTDLFEPIHKKGMALTIHAGENDESEAIWDAVFKLNTRRIGHGLNLFQDPNLLKSVINRRIGIEMCPYANYQIKGFYPMNNVTREYPLLDYLRKGASVTINTDNIGISGASLTDNFNLTSIMNSSLTRMEVLQIIRNGLEQAFIDVELKNKLIQIFNENIFNIIIKLS